VFTKLVVLSIRIFFACPYPAPLSHHM
jgi:hypothetical protein